MEFSITVVIPTFNRAPLLERALVSLSRQTYKKFDVIVSDDGSTEDLRLVVEKFSSTLNIKFIQNQHSGSPAIPRNTAIQASSSTHIAFLDSDDYWHPDKLLYASRKISQGFQFTYHDLKLVRRGALDKDCFFRSKRVISYRMNGENMIRLIAALGNSIPTSSVVVSKQLLELVDLFDTRQKYIAIEDAKAWVDIAKYSPSIARIPKVLGYYEIGYDNNISAFSNTKVQEFRTKVLLNHIIAENPTLSTSCLFYVYKYARCMYDSGDYTRSRRVLESQNYLAIVWSIPWFKLCVQSLILWGLCTIHSRIDRLIARNR